MSAIEIEDIACLMQGFDPRARGDVVVPDPDDPTSPYGMSPDTSWEERMLTAAVLTGDLESAPANTVEPNSDTKVVRESLIPWLRGLGKYDFLADGLSAPVGKRAQAKQADTLRQTKASSEVASTPMAIRPGMPTFSMTKSAMIQQHLREWPTIEADIHAASENGLSIAKAGPRDWVEADAMAWARSKGKLVVPSASTSLASSMNDLVGRKHSIDD